MKHKSKLSLFAAVVLQTLLLIVPVSAYATAEAGQEIGVPQAMEAPAKVTNGCFGAVLSPNGDRFYTVGLRLLTEYQINPFKKISSRAIDSIDWKYLEERKYGGRCRILKTNDKSRLVIVYYDRIYLLDARTLKLVNMFERGSASRSNAAAVVNENELVTLTTVSSGELQPRYFYLTIWDAHSLKLKREIALEPFNFIKEQTYEAMSKIGDRIYLASGMSFLILNSKTYAPELSVRYKPPFNINPPKISKDFKKIYLWNVPSEMTDYLTGKQAGFENPKVTSFLVFDQETREASIEPVDSISNEAFHPSLVSSSQVSRNKEYVMMSLHSDASLLKLGTPVRFKFHPYKSGEAILMERPPDGDKHRYFQYTPGAKQYLMMKNREGKVVPMNDATFAKYNRTRSSP